MTQPPSNSTGLEVIEPLLAELGRGGSSATMEQRVSAAMAKLDAARPQAPGDIDRIKQALELAREAVLVVHRAANTAQRHK